MARSGFSLAHPAATRAPVVPLNQCVTLTPLSVCAWLCAACTIVGITVRVSMSPRRKSMRTRNGSAHRAMYNRFRTCLFCAIADASDNYTPSLSSLVRVYCPIWNSDIASSLCALFVRPVNESIVKRANEVREESERHRQRQKVRSMIAIARHCVAANVCVVYSHQLLCAA